MEKNKINLEELFDNNFDCYTELIIEWIEVEESAMTKEKFKIVIVDFANELLKLAAENSGLPECLNKDAILNTIKQIE